MMQFKKKYSKLKFKEINNNKDVIQFLTCAENFKEMTFLLKRLEKLNRLITIHILITSKSSIKDLEDELANIKFKIIPSIANFKRDKCNINYSFKKKHRTKKRIT